MTTLALETEPTAANITVTEDDLVVDLVDGRCLIVPLAWYPRLMYATAAERQNFQLLGDGYAIEFPDLNEHIGIEGLLAGRHSGESQKSLEKWLNERKRKYNKV
jgi:hypothetical protein